MDALSQTAASASQNTVSVIIRALVEGLTKGISDMLVSCVSAFGMVTLIFAVMERQKVKIERKKAEKWSVGKLSEQREGISFQVDPQIFGSDTGQKGNHQPGRQHCRNCIYPSFSVYC